MTHRTDADRESSGSRVDPARQEPGLSRDATCVRCGHPGYALRRTTRGDLFHLGCLEAQLREERGHANQLLEAESVGEGPTPTRLFVAGESVPPDMLPHDLPWDMTFGCNVIVTGIGPATRVETDPDSLGPLFVGKAHPERAPALAVDRSQSTTSEAVAVSALTPPPVGEATREPTCADCNTVRDAECLANGCLIQQFAPAPRPTREAGAPGDATELTPDMRRKILDSLLSPDLNLCEAVRLYEARLSETERTGNLWRELVTEVTQQRDAEHTARLAAEQERDRYRVALLEIASGRIARAVVDERWRAAAERFISAARNALRASERSEACELVVDPASTASGFMVYPPATASAVSTSIARPRPEPPA